MRSPGGETPIARPFSVLILCAYARQEDTKQRRLGRRPSEPESEEQIPFFAEPVDARVIGPQVLEVHLRLYLDAGGVDTGVMGRRGRGPHVDLCVPRML